MRKNGAGQQRNPGLTYPDPGRAGSARWNLPRECGLRAGRQRSAGLGHLQQFIPQAGQNARTTHEAGCMHRLLCGQDVQLAGSTIEADQLPIGRRLDARGIPRENPYSRTPGGTAPAGGQRPFFLPLGQGSGQRSPERAFAKVQGVPRGKGPWFWIPRGQTGVGLGAPLFWVTRTQGNGRNNLGAAI